MIAAPAVQVEDSTPTFRELVAAELRAQLARRKMSGRALSKLLGENQTWVSRRLNGVIPIDTDDLDRIAAALGMNPMQLLSGVTPFLTAAPQTYEAAQNGGTNGSYFPVERHLVVVEPQLTEPDASDDHRPVVPNELPAQRVASVTRWVKPGRPSHISIVA